MYLNQQQSLIMAYPLNIISKLKLSATPQESKIINDGCFFFYNIYQIYFLFIILIIEMIDQPQFPQSFKQLMLTVVNEQLQADQIKAQINPAEAQELFNRMDTLQTGEICLEDFTNFLKVQRISITQKEMDFLCKYFGLKDNAIFSYEDFYKYFLLVNNPKNKGTVYSFNALQTFLSYIAFMAQSFSKIEDVIADSAVNKQQLQVCLQRYYQSSKRMLNNEIVKECLFDMGMYSRLNVFLVCHHMNCYKNHEIPLQWLFYKQETDTNPVIIERYFTQNQTEIFSFGQDIEHLKIRNNELSVKQKTQEKLKKKPIGTIIKKSSMRSINNIKENGQNLAPSLIVAEKTSMKMIHIDSANKSLFSNTTGFSMSNKYIPNISHFQQMQKTSLSRINSRATTLRVNAYISRQFCQEPRLSRYKRQIRLQYASLQKR